MSASFFLLLIVLAAVVLTPLLLPKRFLSRFPGPLRILAGLGALGIGAFCGFGFLATFEPLDPTIQWSFRLLYVVAGLGTISAAIRLFRIRSLSASL